MGARIILCAKDLVGVDRGEVGQNIETKWVSGKILRKKELAERFSFWLGEHCCIFPMLHF